MLGVYATIMLTILICPIYYKKLYGLELGLAGPEVLLRWIHFLFVVLLVFLFWDCYELKFSSVAIKLIYFSVALSYLEIFNRLLVKHLFPYTFNYFKRLEVYYEQLLSLSEYKNMYTKTVPHPFLQFTGRVDKLNDTGDYEFGLSNLKLSDIPKPNETIRIACIGGSTTEDGYPEFLQSILNKTGYRYKFQVLNFGKGWWTSIHTTVNFVLNVIDFKSDYVIFHENVNDRNYRGFPGLRGDGAHAITAFSISRFQSEWLSRFSILYRFLILILLNKFPNIFNKYIKQEFKIDKVGLKPKFSFLYNPKELYILKRNLEVIHTLCEKQGIKLIIMTMPFSLAHDFPEKNNEINRKHVNEVNKLEREFAKEKNIALVDMDKYMTNKQSCFLDVVHVNELGNSLKAYLVALEILKNYNIDVSDVICFKNLKTEFEKLNSTSYN